MLSALNVEVYRCMVCDYERQVRDCAEEMDSYIKEFYKNVKYYNDKKGNKMEATQLLSEIRQIIDTVRRIRGASTTLRNSTVAAKGHVREMIGQGDWPEVIKEAKNLTHFLAEDALTMSNQLNDGLEDVEELKYLLDSMEI